MLKDTDGFDIIVNGVDRTFRDRRDWAIVAAQYLATFRGNEHVQIRDRASGKIFSVTNDGRLQPAATAS